MPNPTPDLDPDVYRFDRETWRRRGAALTDRYAAAEPFPHIVIDDFLPEAVLDVVVDEFPGFDDPAWGEYSHTHTLKNGCNDTEAMGPNTAHLLNEFNSSAFLPFLEAMTSIDDLIPDPYFVGGGLHFIKPGGFLGIHADFNRLGRYQLDRRLNLLLYLNRDWEESYGGHLELWNYEMTECVQKVLPVFNRCVVFSTTDFSYHGHPDPLTCPEGRARRSLALYYYTNGRPEEERTEAHLTHFPGRPGEAARPGRKTATRRRRRHLRERVKGAVRALRGLS